MQAQNQKHALPELPSKGFLVRFDKEGDTLFSVPEAAGCCTARVRSCCLASITFASLAATSAAAMDSRSENFCCMALVFASASCRSLLYLPGCNLSPCHSSFSSYSAQVSEHKCVALTSRYTKNIEQKRASCSLCADKLQMTCTCSVPVSSCIGLFELSQEELDSLAGLCLRCQALLIAGAALVRPLWAAKLRSSPQGLQLSVAVLDLHLQSAGG